LDQALVESAQTSKPIFLLFQEVPGCSGCKQFGREVLSDSALVAIIEREFIAVLVRNNVGGEEAQILKEYDVPAWNYRVVRFVDASGKGFIPRKDPV
jgi:thioredoxin-related protein